MCSISGIISISDFEQPKSELTATLNQAVQRMNAALRHRGPDDSGIAEVRKGGIVELQLCLGNTRLAIIDTSDAGHQPMHDPETGNWITYNGETYNFRELRREIGDEFGPWRSNTDTEVVLRAYRKWGVAAFSKLRGMFAFAIWDARTSELILARDPFGIKPLYYCKTKSDVGSGLIFASEVRALMASGMVGRKLSPQGVESYLETGSVKAPLTMLADVYSLMPGEVLRVGVGSSTLEINTSTLHAASQANGRTSAAPRNRDEAVAALRTELQESVRMHLVSDVPLGVFLSGGMDSSALVALMSLVSKEKPKTFSVVFAEEQFCEASHSREVAQKFGTDHREVQLSEDSLLKMLPMAIASLDQPTMDGINTYVVSKAVKNAGVKVALSGLGGDELFAGYATFRRALRSRSLRRISRVVRRTVSAAGKIGMNGSVRRKKFWELMQTDVRPLDVYNVTRQLFLNDEIERLTLPTGPEVMRGAASDPQESDDVVNAISKLELQGYMANTLLRDTDSMSMAHSLEVRVPFVDTDVVSYVLPLPGEWKMNLKNGAMPKPLLADAVSDLIPRDFLNRRKMGFTLPFERWMQATLRDEISDVIGNAEQLRKANLDVERVSTLWERFLSSPKSVGWSRPWSLYVLAKWCDINGVTI